MLTIAISALIVLAVVTYWTEMSLAKKDAALQERLRREALDAAEKAKASIAADVAVAMKKKTTPKAK